MKNKQEELFRLKNPRFIQNEEELNKLGTSSESNPYQMIQLWLENIKIIKDYAIYTDDDFQMKLIFQVGFYYLSIYKALNSIKNPTEYDTTDRLKYRALAQEYYPDEVNKIELERVDEDYALTIYLNDIEDRSPMYSRDRFFQPISNDSNIEQKIEHSSELSI
ncbi:hypothetical protein ACTAZI_10675 [Legionella bozemanae]|uniref:hypothetical protein n=1 Tax=Legionella bozemanae TaxID=447 RepID=UPI00399CD0CB